MPTRKKKAQASELQGPKKQSPLPTDSATSPPQNHPLEPYSLTVTCWIQSDRNTFLANIKSNSTIYEVKKDIVSKIPGIPIETTHSYVNNLQIWLANIPDNEVAKNAFAFDEENEIKNAEELFAKFKSTPPKNGHIHIACKQLGK
jgi:hypothetical protein